MYANSIEKSSTTPAGWHWGAILTAPDGGGNSRWLIRDEDGRAVLVHEDGRAGRPDRLSVLELEDSAS